MNAKVCDKCRRDMGAVGSGGYELCGACAGVLVLCPVGDLVGEPHEFAAGSGRLAFLDIMGKAGHVHEVCLGCAHPSSEAVVDGGLELAPSGVQTRAEWIDKRVDDARRVAGGNAGGLELLAIVHEFAGLLAVHFVEDDQ